jgi:Ser/Thr protein kinase RdoA (MazF antagonist)
VAVTTGAPAGVVARRFDVGGEPVIVTALAGGHINASYRVTARRGAFLLQRINPYVFPDGRAVNANVARVTRHLARRCEGTRWRTLELVPTVDGDDWVEDDDGACWRMYRFVVGTTTHEVADTADRAREAARAFGTFTAMLADLPEPPLVETIAGFHDTAQRFTALEATAQRDIAGRLDECRADLAAILADRVIGDVLPARVADGRIPVRTVHNDTKIANVLFDATSDEASCVIDLDTVMPGLSLHDFGDMVRSMASPADEDERDLARVTARPAFVLALAEGYLETAGAVLTASERELLVFGGRVITLEQAARFLADHLDGDRYYRVARPGHNLERARAQLALYRSLTAQEETLTRQLLRLLA